MDTTEQFEEESLIHKTSTENDSKKDEKTSNVPSVRNLLYTYFVVFTCKYYIIKESKFFLSICITFFKMIQESKRNFKIHCSLLKYIVIEFFFSIWVKIKT